MAGSDVAVVPARAGTTATDDHLVKNQFSGVRLSIGLCGSTPCRLLDTSLSV